MYRLIDLPITNAVLLLGESVVAEFQEPENSMFFGKLSLFAQTFFDLRVLSQVPRGCFYPQPRTDAVLIELDPKSRKEIERNPADLIFAYLFRRAKKSGLVVNEMKQTLVEFGQASGYGTLSKSESHQRERANVRRKLKQMAGEYNSSRNPSVLSRHDRDRRNGGIVSQEQALHIIERMGIPEDILKKPFSRLANYEIRTLAASVRGFYSR